MEITQQQVAEELVFPLFRSLDDGYKKKYVRDIWDQFESGIRAAAYTSKLSRFLENITGKMPIVLQAQYSQSVIRIISCGMDEEILNWLREETTYIILMARMKNEERKADYEARRKEIEDGDNYPGHLSMYPTDQEKLFDN